MEIEGAVIREQGQTFAVVVVKPSAMSSNHEAQRVAASYAELFPGVPIVLMSQDLRGIPTYWGRKDIAKFMANIQLTQIPWKKYTIR